MENHSSLGKENNGGGFHISKKIGYALTLIVVAAIVIVGLLVYYVGVMAVVSDDANCLATTVMDETTSKPTKEKVKDVRLPTHLKPLHYRVSLVPFIIPDNFTIKGSISITLEATVDGANNITVHSAETNVTHESVLVEELDNNGNKLGEISVQGHEYDKDREFYITKLNKVITKGNKYRMSMDFISHLNDNLKGFYRSNFKNEEGQTEYIAVTQFQPTDARRAFPCLDEPGLKAKYTVSLGRHKTMTSISNMPTTTTGEAMKGTDEYVWDHYQESVPMSTYLVAFVVSKFGYEPSPDTGNGVDFRIWARKSALDQIAYAKDIGSKILQYFETYFNVKYPLPKQDMIAIPDFAAGAMENWGLITYRETALLYKDKVSAAVNKQRIATVISHELAHQWFGNLVTPSWWTDLWLNEGFASYVEYLGVEAVQPQLKLLEQFVYQDMQDVLRIDALATSHPISIPVKHPDEINEIFDRISYAKGASIIRMMDHFMTEKSFRGGLTNYLKEFSFKAATQDDLWRYLTQQAHTDNTLPSDVSIKTIMDTWTLQMGFPVVSVTRNYDSNEATLVQKRFLLSAPLPSDTGDYKWWIPVTFTKPGGNFNKTYNKIWMKDSEKVKVISDLPERNEAAIFNVQQTGYYRVNYDEQNWKLIIKQLNEDHTKIHVINRAQIIDDALNLARVGLLKYELALEVTSYLNSETEYIPWAAALTGFRYLEEMLKRTSAYGDFKTYMRTLIDPLYKRLTYQMQPNDENLDIFLRTSAVAWACGLGHPDCKQETRSQYSEWMEMLDPDDASQNPINVNLKRSVYCQAISNGDESQWDFGWERYTKSNVATEKDMLLAGLSCTKQIWLLNRYLDMCLTKDSGIRKADGRTVISRIATNSVGRDLAFNFVRENWDTVVSYYGSASFALSSLMKFVLKNRNTPFELDEIKKFQEKNEATLTTAQREVKQAIENAEANIAWMSTNYDKISSWLSEKKKKKH